MPPWLARHDAPARGQRALTMATRVRKDIDPLIHTLDRDQGATVARMARLATRLAATLRAAPSLPLTSRKAVR